jgi:hypothetical protein
MAEIFLMGALKVVLSSGRLGSELLKDVAYLLIRIFPPFYRILNLIEHTIVSVGYDTTARLF